jgi:hypothetical protein
MPGRFAMLVPDPPNRFFFVFFYFNASAATSSLPRRVGKEKKNHVLLGFVFSYSPPSAFNFPHPSG